MQLRVKVRIAHSEVRRPICTAFNESSKHPPYNNEPSIFKIPATKYKKSWENHSELTSSVSGVMCWGTCRRRSARLSEAPPLSLSARRGEAECDVAGRLPDDFVRLIRGGRCRQNTDADVRESKRVFFLMSTLQWEHVTARWLM